MLMDFPVLRHATSCWEMAFEPSSDLLLSLAIKAGGTLHLCTAIGLRPPSRSSHTLPVQQKLSWDQ